METWPDALRPARGGRPIYVPRNTAGTITLSGFTQVISSDAGTWKFAYEGIPINGWPDIQLWDSLLLRLEGRLNPFLVTVCEGRRQPQFSGGGFIDGIPHSDGALFSDGGGYSQFGVQASVAANAAARATTLSIVMPSGAVLQPAQFFSIGVRLYQVKAAAAPVVGVQALSFLPPLREPVTVGAAVVFDRPVCKVRLATDNAMERILDYNRIGRPSVLMLEDPN